MQMTGVAVWAKGRNASSKSLTEGIDYSVIYGKNTDAGTGQVTVRGGGAYAGDVTKEFQLIDGNLSSNRTGIIAVLCRMDNYFG